MRCLCSDYASQDRPDSFAAWATDDGFDSGFTVDAGGAGGDVYGSDPSNAVAGSKRSRDEFYRAAQPILDASGSRFDSELQQHATQDTSADAVGLRGAAIGAELAPAVGGGGAPTDAITSLFPQSLLFSPADLYSGLPVGSSAASSDGLNGSETTADLDLSPLESNEIWMVGPEEPDAGSAIADRSLVEEPWLLVGDDEVTWREVAKTAYPPKFSLDVRIRVAWSHLGHIPYQSCSLLVQEGGLLARGVMDAYLADASVVIDGVC
jgi:hypothetical protein